MTALLHDLLKQSAAVRPDQIAVRTKQASISYSQLDHMTDQVAERLIRCGATQGSRIGLLVHKSVEAYVAIYGVLKAGCAYVPLDRMAPAERLAYIIDDCQVETVITTEEAGKRVAEIIETGTSLRNVVQLDGQTGGVAGAVAQYGPEDIFELNADERRHIVDSDLAYILYTSGSTGQPKGVMISHAVSMSFVEWAADCAGLTSADRVSGHAPLHFDLSIFDVFATAKASATLFPVADGTSTFPTVLTDWIIDNKISVWYSVPSILSMMAKQRSFSARTFESLRLVLFAGEVFPVKYLKIWLEALPEATFMNWYGPTETNVVTSYAVVESADELDSPVPIGRATSNAELFCIDEQGAIVASAGTTGELCARGPCVALGYWGDREKTDLRFVPNDQRPWLRDRFYKTGDLVSRDDNGNFIYQGRVDHQIKCRGYRIEIGEIESALYRVGSVQEAAVVAVPDDTIGNRLVAFLVLTRDNAGSPEQVSDQIGKFLPKYMLPEKFLIEKGLPKTSNGKVDRQELLRRALLHYK